MTESLQLVAFSTAADRTEIVHARLAEYVDSLELRHNQKAEMKPHYELAILCPDDGVQAAYRGTCPKCGGRSWLPAGAWGGYESRMRVRHVRTEMQKVMS